MIILPPDVYARDLVLVGITQDQYKACKWYGQMTENYNAAVLREMGRWTPEQVAALRDLNDANNKLRVARTEEAKAAAIDVHAAALDKYAALIHNEEKAA